MNNRSFLPVVFVSIAALLFFWVTFLPAQLGGWVTYVIVDGISMEPGFVFGDLVLVRTQTNYEVGDAVVYWDDALGSYVFHRIVDMEIDRYILQGDNNAWVDSYHPTRDEIVGKLWLHAPKLGRMIEWMRTPLNLALAVGLVGGVFMFDLFKKPKQKGRENSPFFQVGDFSQIAFFSFGMLALLFLGSGIFAFIRPLNRPAENIPYQQDGMYYYSATGTPGVYDTDVVRSGEPVFTKLTCFLNIGYTYNILGDRLQGAAGTYKMYARILDEQGGWQRTLPLNADTIFSGNTFFSMATLDLCQMESLVQLVEQEAGLKQVSYTLEIVTDVSFVATAEGNLVSDSFSQTLPFKYDKVQFYLAGNDPQVDPLHSTKPGQVESSVLEANTISFLGLTVSVWVVRLISLFGFGASLIGLGVIGMGLYQAASQSQEALTQLKYGSMLVDVVEQNLAPTSSIIDVASVDDLARLAERHGTMMLHTTRNFLQFYFVQVNGTTYRYVFSTGRKGIEEPDPLPAEKEAPVVVRSTPAPEPISKPVHHPTPEPIHKHKRSYSPPVQDEFFEMELPKQAQEQVEYVIKTGEIEFVMPPRRETVMLKQVRL